MSQRLAIGSAAWLLASVAVFGCNQVLGIREKQLADAASAGAEGIELSVTQQMLRIVRGQSAQLDVSLQRSGGFAGVVTVAVTGLPNGVTAEPLTFEGSRAAGKLILDAASAADRGTATIQIYGLSQSPSASTQSLQLVVQDAPGSEDLMFGAASGTPGRVAISLGTGGASVGANGLQITPMTGTLVLCGAARTDLAPSSIALVRLTVDGAPDLTFGTAGVLLINSPGSTADGCNAMFLRPGGGANLAGFATPVPDGTQDVVLARYTPLGPPDLNFGQGGFVTTPLGDGGSAAYALVTGQNDGYVAACAGPGGSAFVGYKKNGQLDPTFGANGFAALGGDSSAAVWLAAQSSGNFVAALAADTFRLVRLTPVGKVDSTFGDNGIVSAGPGGSRSAVALVAPQPQDAVLVVGTVTQASGSRDIAVARFTPSGQLDTTFGSAGWGIVHFGTDPSISSVSSAVLQTDGSVVIAGQTPTADGEVFSVVRLSPGGVPDLAFGPGGRQTFDIGGFAQALVIDSVGRIVVAGTPGPASPPGEIVAYRLWP